MREAPCENSNKEVAACPTPDSSSGGARPFAVARRKPSRRQRATVEYFAGLQSDGAIESFEPVFLEQHGGDLDGFFFIRGDAEQLASLRFDPDFEDVILRASLIVDKIGVVGAATGARLERQMSTFIEAVAQFA